MVQNINVEKYIVVAIGFCLVATSGVVGGLVAIENDLKKYLDLSQKGGTSIC